MDKEKLAGMLERGTRQKLEEKKKEVEEEVVFLRIMVEAEEVKGLWNGDELGLQEERAGLADEIQGKVHELKELLNELRN